MKRVRKGLWLLELGTYAIELRVHWIRQWIKNKL